MNLKKFIVSSQVFFMFFILTLATVHSQVFKIADQNHINDFAIEGDYLWVATDGGVVKFNTVDQSYVLYTTADGLKSNYVTSLYIDASGNKWFGTYEGVTKFDG